MRVSPTSEQLGYLSSLGVYIRTPKAEAMADSGSIENVAENIVQPPSRIRARAVLGLMAGVCSGAIGLLFGGFFGVVTYGMLRGSCVAACAAFGWLLIGFLWTYSWKTDDDMSDEIAFSNARPGIGVAMTLAVVGFGPCFCGMLLAGTIGGQEIARAWLRVALAVLWMVGFVPGVLLAAYRLTSR